MKKLLSIVAMTLFLTSCGSGNSDTDNSGQSRVSGADRVKKASDSVMQTGDTSALNGPMGDSTSLSRIHRKNSGSKVGTENAGGLQSKKGK